MTAVSEQTSSGPQILGNFPRFEMIFVCTDKPAAAAREDPYDKIMRLKKLLDAGAISQEEFDREKRKLLDQ